LFSSIVVALDMEGIGERALPVTRSLARRSGLPVEAVTVAAPDKPGVFKVWDVEKLLSARGIGSHSIFVLHEDDPARAIAAHIGNRDGVLLVMATTAKGALGERVQGSVSEDVLSHVHQPVLLVGPNVGENCELASPTLVACVDGSPHTEAALPVIAKWTKTFGGGVPWLAEVVPARPGAAAPQGDLLEAAHVRSFADRLAARGVHASWEVLHGGDPVAALEDFTNQVADAVLVVTSERWAGTTHWFSTTRKLARWSSRPVLVVPADLSAS
jgi:nucleotide-binding universal stress UspA family protein